MEAVIKPTQRQQCFLDANGLTTEYLVHAQQWFMPIAQQISVHHKSATRPLIIGINGCQGSGKSTLTDYLKLVFNETFGLTCATMSMDDFYLSKTKRNQLAKQVHPMLATRGVPGTHDFQHIAQVFNALQTGEPTLIPRFNKAIDDPFPQSEWTKIDSAVDLIIMEGWCWGTPAQAEIELTKPMNQLEAEHDSNGAWRNYVNTQVKTNYQPLYNQTDIMLMLKAPTFQCVKQWRLEQEQKLAARLSDDDDRSGLMNEQQIEEFISYFQRLTEYGFNTLPAQSYAVWQLQNDRSIASVSCNKEISE